MAQDFHHQLDAFERRVMDAISALGRKVDRVEQTVRARGELRRARSALRTAAPG
jgi:hypothetical protein